MISTDSPNTVSKDKVNLYVIGLHSKSEFFYKIKNVARFQEVRIFEIPNSSEVKIKEAISDFCSTSTDQDVLLFLPVEKKAKGHIVDSVFLLKLSILQFRGCITLILSDLAFANVFDIIPSKALEKGLKKTYASKKLAHSILLASTRINASGYRFPAISRGKRIDNIKNILMTFYSKINTGMSLNLETQTPSEIGEWLDNLADKQLVPSRIQSNLLSLSTKVADAPSPRFGWRNWDSLALTQSVLVEHDLKSKNFPSAKVPLDIITPVLKDDLNFRITERNLEVLSRYFDVNWIVVTPDDELHKDDPGSPSRITLKDDGNGIYQAYNLALKHVKSSAYLPLNAGDVILPSAIFHMLEYAEEDEILIVFAPPFKHGKVRSFSRKFTLNTGTHKIIPGHSASALIKLRAHELFGTYDESFDLAADSLFMESVCDDPTRFAIVDCMSGFFDTGGASMRRYNLAISEHRSVRKRLGYSPIAEWVFFWLRKVRNHV